MKEIILTIIGSGGFAALISGFITLLSNRGRTRDGIRDSLYFQIRQTGLDCIRDGCIDAPTLEAICKAHDTYEKLGGNGYIDSIMERIKKLPIKHE